MYIGHVGVALAAKRARARIGLLALLLATYAPDGVDAGLCVANAYNDQAMLSHSIPAVVLLAVVGLAMYALLTRDITGGLLIAAVVLSHMVLDWVTGYKPTWPGGPMIGLQLYGRPLLDFLAEAAVILVGVMFYAPTLPTRKAIWLDVAMMLGALLALQVTVDIAHAMTTSLRKC